jgi:phosphoribosylglycinamide formyltransferase 1
MGLRLSKPRVAVLISGNGSNLQALMDAASAPDYPAQIALVISNKPDAYGLTRAKTASVPSVVISHQDFSDRESFDRAMDATLREHKIDLVCLAGFMRLLSPWFVNAWRGTMLNIHPSLLPAFKGAHAIRDALNVGAKTTGCTVHYVTEEMDAGEILGQMEVPILPDDTEETLAKRIHAAEHMLYPQVLKKYANTLK